ncbi:MAG: hypothetical protein K5899_10410 [Bacteroidaceae bacterium]|jgi:hypothetical protein|nr:hypothetical protein [Bacteroidaceae bacterium]
MAIILKNAPKTEAYRGLKEAAEKDDRFKMVFGLDMETQQIEVVEIWNPDKKYDNHFVIVPLSSSYVGIVLMKAGKEVRNVKKSTKDPKPAGYTSWLELMRDKYAENGITENVDDCCLDANEYDVVNGVEAFQPTTNHNVDYHDNRSWVGGHMVKNGDSQTLNPGDDFYLLHICKAHNFFQRDKFYFKTAYQTNALHMTNFFMSYPALRSALFALVDKSKTDEDVEFDIKEYCEKNSIELKNMYFE